MILRGIKDSIEIFKNFDVKFNLEYRVGNIKNIFILYFDLYKMCLK